MEIVVEPDIYMPSIDEQGNYIDRVCVFKKGLTCMCGSRKDKVYETQSMFSAHVKTKHIKGGYTTLIQTKQFIM